MIDGATIVHMSDSELDDAASQLYSVDPAEFVAARTSAVSAAKESGNRVLAAAIGKLRKPTTVAWLVNLLVREEPEHIAELFELGESLREAQRKSNSGELRALSATRQKAIKTLTSMATEIARTQGKSIDDTASREVGQTLVAALADPDIAERVRSGRVLTAESYSGFGPASLTLVPDSDDSAGEHDRTGSAEQDPVQSPSPDDSARREAADALRRARESLADAEDDEDSARQAAEGAASELDDAHLRVAEVKSRLARLRRELHAAEEDETAARATEKSAERESRRLHRILGDAENRTAELRDAVDGLID